MEKNVRFGSWSELMRAIPGYEKLGYECEVRGYEAISNNILTIRDALEKEGKDERR